MLYKQKRLEGRSAAAGCSCCKRRSLRNKLRRGGLNPDDCYNFAGPGVVVTSAPDTQESSFHRPSEPACGQKHTRAVSGWLGSVAMRKEALAHLRTASFRGER